MKEKVLVTGASGFVGSHLVELLLSEGHEVLGLVYGGAIPPHPLLSTLSVNLMDKEAVLCAYGEFNPDWLIHLAAQSSPALSFKQPEETISNNLITLLNVLETARKKSADVKILSVGSADMYGKVLENEFPITENNPFRPTSPYAESKIIGDRISQMYSNIYEMDIVRVRPFNHLGERQAPNFAIPSWAKQIALIEANKQTPIIKVGNLDTYRDFCDVKDMVKAYVMAMQMGIKGEVYNIGSGREYNMSEVLKLLISLSTKAAEIKIEIDPDKVKPSDTPRLLANTDKFKTLTGWEATIPLEETLKRVLKYWREQVEII